jgi:hypothetical protein
VSGASSDAVLHFAWSSSSGRVKAAYRAEVLNDQSDDDRFVCRLSELLAVERAGDTPGDEALRGLIGKHVRVPREALDGTTLPLKMATLTGGLSRPYFFDES